MLFLFVSKMPVVEIVGTVCIHLCVCCDLVSTIFFKKIIQQFKERLVGKKPEIYVSLIKGLI